MQRIPPQGPHNPNGHSEDTVLAAIQGLSGSRKITYRYELLDGRNRKLRDLTDNEVEANSAKISLNNLAKAIKRTATFRMRTPSVIDWLSDRIKPWHREHLPPWGPNDWVEFPLGVFLPTTPSKETDATRVTWRSVDADDQAIVLADDQIPARYSTDGLLDAHDQFRRQVQDGWGNPDLGPAWDIPPFGGPTNRGVSLDLDGHAWVELPTDSNLVRFQQFNRRYRDAEVHARIAVEQASVGAPQIPGALLRFQSASDFYRVRLIFQPNGTVDLDVANRTTRIGAAEQTGITYRPGQWIHLRARMVDQTVLGKAWAQGTPEPVAWQIDRDFNSATLGEGFFGVTSSTFSDNTNNLPIRHRFGLVELDANPENLVTGHVRRVLEQGGVATHNITPSNQRLSNIREWEPGTTRLTIVNELLSSINYRSLSFDEHGLAVCSPYVSPNDRAPEYAYLDDERSIMLPGVTEERDLHAIPNQWVLSSGDAESDPTTVVFTNRHPGSPTSVPRRGRIITDFRSETDAVSESALIEQAARLAAESSQVYEALEFSTALNPLHSFDDVFSIRRDDAAIDGHYTSHTWEMSLSPEGTMAHRARRVVSVGAASDPGIVVGDAEVIGAIEAGNIATGTITISPTPGVPTPVAITGLNLAGTGGVRVQVTADTTVPGSIVKDVAIRDPTPQGFTIWLLRTSSTNTTVQWLAIRGA
ncbi:hypothetical protein ACWFMI_23500 [Nocardiopsis terrae]|uniref:hypothetical protein n=1 Tax=Streptomyces sp. NPDC057554 TaxID=3350538 RepID=UPI0036973EFF